MAYLNNVAQSIGLWVIPPLLMTIVALAHASADGADQPASASAPRFAEEQTASDETVFDVITRRDLVRLNHVRDAIAVTAQHLRITGKEGEVYLRAGETKLIELPRPTRSLEWRMGEYKPETIEDIRPFDFVLIQWKKDGHILWIEYQSKTLQTAVP